MSVRSVDLAAPRPGVGARLLRKLLPSLDCGELALVTPTGELVTTSGIRPGPTGTVVLHRWRALRRLLAGGDLGFAEAYIDGDWSSPDLLELLNLAVLNTSALDRDLRASLPLRLLHRVRHRLNANTRRGSRRNVAFHYDLGNDFYRLWLDPKMIYSSALYGAPDWSLEQAQEAKLARIVGELQPQPGHRILEIGSGWGALALRLAGLGASVTGVTLSNEQLRFSRELARQEGLADRCVFSLEDYRTLSGRYDRIVSIEMLEAVGELYWPRYFSKLHDLLAPDGVAVLQVITIDEPRFQSYRRRPDFIQRHVFPGGMLPTRGAIVALARAAGLAVTAVETFGQSYALTLEEWRRRFLRAADEIASLGADQRFRRLWEYYLCYCAAGFRGGSIDVGLYTLRHA